MARGPLPAVLTALFARRRRGTPPRAGAFRRVSLIRREGADYHVGLPREREDLEAGCTIRILSADPVGDGVDEVMAEYVLEDARWTRTFRSRALSAEQFEGCLDEARLVVDRYLTPDGVWVPARPAQP